MCPLKVETRSCNSQACPPGVTPTVQVCQVSAFMDGPCVAGNYVQSIRYITQSGVNCPALLQTLVYRASCQQPLSGNDDEGDRTGTMSYMCLGGCTTSTTDMTTIDNNVTF
eukprot:TRINITY_DN5066_c0_g1_i2.p1 TRINITY_DN5066_c0_g1~~TRINITY_DN5066_c0_g1_i2.p1  ORF type:complete len:111 (+),score=17.25 TRINITY_DN5066_c0_g1_i2:327-659(+)